MKLKISYIIYLIIGGFIIFLLAHDLNNRIQRKRYKFSKSHYNQELAQVFLTNDTSLISIKQKYISIDSVCVNFLSIKNNIKAAIIINDNFKCNSFSSLKILRTDGIALPISTFTYLIEKLYPTIGLPSRRFETEIKGLIIHNSARIFEQAFGQNYFYLKGSFQDVGLLQKRLCSMVIFPTSNKNEILLLKTNDIIYIIASNSDEFSIRDFINYKLLN